MQNIEELIISREDSYIFFQVDCIPVHPSVVNEFKENKSLDYELMNKSLDDALDWTYRDLKEHPELIPKREFLSPLQTMDGKWTTDIEVIQSWLKHGHHSYYQQENEVMRHGSDVKKFPFSGLNLVDSGIYIGSKPIIITYDQAPLFKKTLEYLDKKDFLPKPILNEYGIIENDSGYLIPATWYTKDARPLIKLFGKNFATSYNNAKVQRIH